MRRGEEQPIVMNDFDDETADAVRSLYLDPDVAAPNESVDSRDPSSVDLPGVAVLTGMHLVGELLFPRMCHLGELLFPRVLLLGELLAVLMLNVLLMSRFLWDLLVHLHGALLPRNELVMQLSINLCCALFAF